MKMVNWVGFFAVAVALACLSLDEPSEQSVEVELLDLDLRPEISEIVRPSSEAEPCRLGRVVPPSPWLTLSLMLSELFSRADSALSGASEAELRITAAGIALAICSTPAGARPRPAPHAALPPPPAPFPSLPLSLSLPASLEGVGGEGRRKCFAVGGPPE